MAFGAYPGACRFFLFLRLATPGRTPWHIPTRSRNSIGWCIQSVQHRRSCWMAELLVRSSNLFCFPVFGNLMSGCVVQKVLAHTVAHTQTGVELCWRGTRAPAASQPLWRIHSAHTLCIIVLAGFLDCGFRVSDSSVPDSGFPDSGF